MNFSNPFLYTMPTATRTAGLLSRINFGSIINGTSRALNLVNQSIPLFKSMSPMMRNAKTMFKVMNEFKKTDISVYDNDSIDTITKTDETSNYNYSTNTPTFFA
jgi:hypothetical protein